MLLLTWALSSVFCGRGGGGVLWHFPKDAFRVHLMSVFPALAGLSPLRGLIHELPQVFFPVFAICCLLINSN